MKLFEENDNKGRYSYKHSRYCSCQFSFVCFKSIIERYKRLRRMKLKSLLNWICAPWVGHLVKKEIHDALMFGTWCTVQLMFLLLYYEFACSCRQTQTYTRTEINNSCNYLLDWFYQEDANFRQTYFMCEVSTEQRVNEFLRCW